MTSVKHGATKKVEVKEIIIELNSLFKGKVVFKPILKSCNIGEYNDVSGTISNVSKDILYYGFDWYRDRWNSSIPAEQQLSILNTSNFPSRVLNVAKSTGSINVYSISGETVERNYKIAHQVVNGSEKLIRFSEHVTFANGEIEEDVTNNTITRVLATQLNISFSHFLIEELNFATGVPTGVKYKSTDADLTKYNQFINAFGNYASCTTMICLSSIKTLKKEYYPVNIYKKSTLGSSILALNNSKQMLKINSSEYLVPWYASFDKSENEIQLEIDIDSANSIEGEIKILVPKEYQTHIVVSGDISVLITTGDSGSVITKKIKIKFDKPIEKNTVLEARFFPKNKEKYLGDIIGLLNIFRNKTEYNLSITNVNVNFRGELRRIPILNDKLSLANIDFNIPQLSVNNKYFPTSPPTIVNKAAILNSNNLQTYINSNYDFLKTTLGQSLIKCLPSPNSVLNINLEGEYNLYSGPTPPGGAGSQNIKRSLQEYSGYNDFTFIIKDTDLFIKGLIEAYESIHGTADRGVINFILPFTILEPDGTGNYSEFKGRANSVDYESKYLLLARSTLLMNAYEVPLHEIGHTLGLHHPFVDFNIPSKYHFIKSETNNVMDYPKQDGSPIPADFGIYFYKWQWEIMHGDIQTTTNRGDLIKVEIL